jgi:hypothetical protein
MNRGEQLMSQNVESGVKQMLTSLGFENIRTAIQKDTLTLAYENNIYRWDVRGLNVVIDSVARNVQPQIHLRIITLKNDIPVFETSLLAGDWEAFRRDSLSRDQLKEKLVMTFNTDNSWDQLRNQTKSNRNLFKFDLVFYPYLNIRNIYYMKVYEIMFSIGPALEFSLWKGNKFTGQVIFPIYADVTWGAQNIRPGYVTVSQSFRLPGPLFCNVTVGKFDASRYGIDLEVLHYFKNQHWKISGNLGLTGINQFYENVLYLSTTLSPNGLIKVGYFYSPFNLETEISAGRDINGYNGIRIDFTRHFGETSVGFYASHSITENVNNFGFQFSIPLPPGKRSRKHHLRVLPPRYFDWTYVANSKARSGFFYQSSPDNNASQDYFNLIYIKNSLH